MSEIDLGGGIEGLPLRRKGKVRDLYGVDGRLLLVATDRLSAFDFVLREGIPGKGKVLTRLSAFWFGRTAGIVPNHLLGTDVDALSDLPPAARERLRGRTMIVREADVLPFEFVVRGYLTGSGLASYEQTGEVCGVRLPPGLVEASALPAPILTPTTKAAKDVPVTLEEVERAVGSPLARRAREAALAVYGSACAYARERGILIADTKFEFGVAGGELLLVDECLTPDSSRFWPARGYAPGRAQPSLDKQVVRDHLLRSGWDRRSPPPSLPPDVVSRTAALYGEICERLTGSRP
ncbi:MAG TPA: phosphoribosylaminoimidazolesuccinocarboxamide synthase [Planctomycetota bacterium]|jgi:phosphoribosylaminoimidazole-succinocarboxamide synthase|nr:phosphoribosylaminoimidazolesuccinocarboxamide synthase [Planctomycetota bacterium]